MYPFQLDPGDVMWIERYEVSCRPPRRRALLMVRNGDAVEAVPLAPGATLADPQLQVEAGRLARMTALARGPRKCPQATVVETALTKRPAKAGAPWVERWSVHACGDVVDMDLAFTPLPEGRTAVAVPAERGGTGAEVAADRRRDQDHRRRGSQSSSPKRGGAEAQTERWMACQNAEELTERIEACERLVTADSLGREDLATAHRRLGDAYRAQAHRKREDRDYARELRKRVFDAYGRAIELNPQDPETYNRRASLHGDDEIEKTMADYSKAIELGTTDTKPYYLHAEYLKKQSKLDLAIADMSRATDLKPYGRYFRDRGVLHHAKGDYETAIADYASALGLDPSRQPVLKASRSEQARYYHLRGLAYLQMANAEQALADFGRSADLIAASLLLQYHRGLALTQKGDHERAAAEFTEVIDRGRTTVGSLRDPLTGDWINYRDFVASGYRGRALALTKAGRAVDGLADVEHALKLGHAKAATLEIRGVINAALGRKDDAIADFRSALAIEPKRPLSLKGLQRLGVDR